MATDASDSSVSPEPTRKLGPKTPQKSPENQINEGKSPSLARRLLQKLKNPFSGSDCCQGSEVPEKKEPSSKQFTSTKNFKSNDPQNRQAPKKPVNKSEFALEGKKFPALSEYSPPIKKLLGRPPQIMRAREPLLPVGPARIPGYSPRRGMLPRGWGENFDDIPDDAFVGPGLRFFRLPGSKPFMREEIMEAECQLCRNKVADQCAKCEKDGMGDCRPTNFGCNHFYHLHCICNFDECVVLVDHCLVCED